MKHVFLQSLLWRLLLPVIVIGAVCSIALNHFLVPPLISTLEQRIDKTINHAASLAENICEERLNDMFDLRLEASVEMNSASKKEALEGIKEIAAIFPDIRMMVINVHGEIQGASFAIPPVWDDDVLSRLEGINGKKGELSTMPLWGESVLLQVIYFPFWRWYIVSFMPEKEYYAPIIMAERIVQLGTFGTLLAVVASVLLLFLLRINWPLKKIILATDKVREGNLTKIGMKGSGEIEQVAVAFDHMVEKLEFDKKKIEHILQDLSDSEEEYRILSESSLALVLMLKRDIFLYANKMASSFFKMTFMDLVGKSVFSLYQEDSNDIFREKLNALGEGESMVEHFEAPFTIDGSEEQWLEILASVVTYQGERAILFHAINITKRKRMEKEQEKLNEKIVRGERMEALGTLAGGVAHDLNNVLGGIVGYPELLLQELTEEDNFYKPLQTIHKSGVKAAAIVQDLLTLTRRGVIVTEVVNLCDIIKEYFASPEFESLLSFSSAIKVTTEISPDLMNIQGSHLHLSKSLMNLVTNAVEAMPFGGTIMVKAENRYVDIPIGSYENIVVGEYVVLSIGDSGEGISADDIDKIFEPFYTKKIMGRSGTGLGMSVVWGTVKDHNGYIEVSSKRGEGTAFTLYFPVSRKEIAEEQPSFAIEEMMGQGEKILVIDDVEEQRIIATSMLEKLGYLATSISSGEEAVTVVADSEYDLLLIDMIMEPGMDGLATYREILKLNPYQKAIIASGFSETERVRRTMELGAGAYIKKPYGLELLAITVKDELMRNPAKRSIVVDTTR